MIFGIFQGETSSIEGSSYHKFVSGATLSVPQFAGIILFVKWQFGWINSLSSYTQNHHMTLDWNDYLQCWYSHFRYQYQMGACTEACEHRHSVCWVMMILVVSTGILQNGINHHQSINQSKEALVKLPDSMSRANRRSSCGWRPSLDRVP